MRATTFSYVAESLIVANPSKPTSKAKAARAIDEPANQHNASGARSLAEG
jgi:hypothetical protein